MFKDCKTGVSNQRKKVVKHHLIDWFL